MQAIDLNLLLPLDALLTERSVTGDPLPVPAGRSLVPTPYAEEISGHVHALCRDVQAVLQPAAVRLGLASLHRTFTIRAGEGVVELMAAPVMAAVADTARHVRLRFPPKPDKGAEPLRDGRIDLEIGVLGTSAPELLTQLLFRDRLVGVARSGHPLLAGGAVTAERYAACGHVAASRRWLRETIAAVCRRAYP